MRVCETDNNVVVQLLDHLYLDFEILPLFGFIALPFMPYLRKLLNILK